MSSKALSPIFVAILLIGISFVAATAVYVFTMSTTKERTATKPEYVGGSFRIESVKLIDNKLVFCVRNTGGTPLKISDVYLREQSGTWHQHFSRGQLSFSDDGVLEPTEVEQVTTGKLQHNVYEKHYYELKVVCEMGLETVYLFKGEEVL